MRFILGFWSWTSSGEIPPEEDEDSKLVYLRIETILFRPVPVGRFYNKK